MGRKYLGGPEASKARRKEKLIEYQREYYLKHREKMLARSKRWQIENKTRAGELVKAYRIRKIERLKFLEEENKNLKKDLEHRDSFFSIMRDVLANETITNNEIAMITYCVVHEECGDYDLSEKELEVVKKFRNREYV